LDDPLGVMKFKDAYFGGRALIVLGGTSAKDWQSLRDRIQPTVILGANGTCFEIDDLDFHVIVENMRVAFGYAARGDEHYRRVASILNYPHHATTRMVSYLSWSLVEDRSNVIAIRRMGERGQGYDLDHFNFREYGDGFLAGPMLDHPSAMRNQKTKYRVGTVAVQLLHLAGILGCFEVHTIGMDFSEYVHWYKYPQYQPDHFRSQDMFTEYKGLLTQWDWMQGADWLKTMQPIFERDGLEWHDHSNGLLQAKGLWCADE